MTAKPVRFVCALALGLAAASGARAQETGKTKDSALDSLLEKLGDRDQGTTSPPSKKAAKPSEPATAKSQTDRSGSGEAPKADAGAKPPSGGTEKTSGAQKGKPAPKTPGSGTVAPKDQAIDDLLGKLGETKDEPARDDQPRNPGGGAGEQPKEQTPRTKGSPAKLGAKDKAIDDQLEEIAGRKRKRPRADQDERSGPVGEMIKEMRDVEQRLGKPDSGEDTQNKQKQIIKRIDTLIEQVRQSGSSAGKLTMRMRRQQGNQPGQQPGDQPGALAQGARPMKPAKPTSQHSTSGGQGAWGHLPPELREEMENSFKEAALGSKFDMISRYFLSIAKGKHIREGE